MDRPPKHDEATLQYQLDAIAAKPAAVGFTRVNTTQFDDAIRAAQDEGIFVILYNTASEGYQDLGVAYVGQEFIPAGIVSGLNAARHAKEITGRDDGIIILGTIAPGHSALDARMEGARQGIAQYNEENGTSYTTEDLTTSTDAAEAIAKLDARWAAGATTSSGSPTPTSCTGTPDLDRAGGSAGPGSPMAVSTWCRGCWTRSRTDWRSGRSLRIPTRRAG